MRIGVLETGEVPEDLRARHGDYPLMFSHLLREADPGLKVAAFRVVRGAMPPGPDAADGWIVTGSRHAVYEPHAWIAPLTSFLRTCLERRVPLVGICFGHQLLAVAAGGRVEKATGGWCAGVHDYTLAAGAPGAAASGLPARAAVRVLHQDQVVRKPPGARVFARSAGCPIAGLAYGVAPHALGLQAHPEFTAAFLDDLIARRADGVIPAPLAREARASLARPVADALWGAWLAGFFRTARAPAPVPTP
jgi:GMP synthase-like glutamine amidotransferase